MQFVLANIVEMLCVNVYNNLPQHLQHYIWQCAVIHNNKTQKTKQTKYENFDCVFFNDIKKLQFNKYNVFELFEFLFRLKIVERQA